MGKRIKELKVKLSKKKLSEDGEWMENAEKQFKILSDIAKLLKGEVSQKTRGSRPSDIKVETF